MKSADYDPSNYKQIELIDAPGILGWIGQRRLKGILSLISSTRRDFSRANVLDVGCGYGEILAELPGRDKTGIDANMDALERARDRVSNATFVLSNVSELPLPDNSFDIVVCSEVLEHFDAPTLLAKELWRVVKPDGVLCVTVPNEWISTLGRFLLNVKPYKSIAHKQWFTPTRLSRLFPAPFSKRINIPFPLVPFLMSTNVAALLRKPRDIS